MNWECCCEKDVFYAVWSGWKVLWIVVSSKIPFDVGMEGIVLLELENVFVLLLMLLIICVKLEDWSLSLRMIWSLSA